MTERGIAVVTGATSGIGTWIALGLARAGLHVVLVGRDRERGEAARGWIAQLAPASSTELLLADLASVRETAELGRSIADRHPRVALLVNNAGVFRARHTVTAEGHDEVLAVNLLAPFVLMRELEAALRAGAPSRIVTVGSSTADRATIDPSTFGTPGRWGMVRAYAQSKLAVMLVTFEWARRMGGTGVVANVVHPGTVATGLVRESGVIGLSWRIMAPWIRTPEQGAETPLHVALSPGLADATGLYFKDRRPVQPNAAARDAALVRRVWETTERLALQPSRQR